MDREGNPNPPPIPSRQKQWPVNNARMPYNSYSPVNNYTFPHYTPSTYPHPYGFGGYGGINRFNQDVNHGSFSQAAEQSSRRAFQSIESIVNAFASVSMMLESSYQAVYSSFHAVIGVADNFSRLKTHLIGVLSALSLFRFLRSVYQYLLRLLGLQPTDSPSTAWQEASSVTSDLRERLKLENDKCNWPILVYMSIIFGAPWLIWKLLAKFVTNNSNADWMTGEGDHYVARVAYDFAAQNPDEITCQTNQVVKVAPKELQPMIKDWLLASGNGQTSGLIPATYVKILGHRRGTKHSPDSQHNQSAKSDTGDGDDLKSRDGDVE